MSEIPVRDLGTPIAEKSKKVFGSEYSSKLVSLHHIPIEPDLYSKQGIAKPCTYLLPAPSTSTQLSAKPLTLLFEKIFAFNWAISPNLGRKIQNCSLWLKTGLHGILEVLIPNPDLNFWNSDLEINFWVNLGRKTKKCPFCLKIDTLGIWRILILIPKLFVWISKL